MSEVTCRRRDVPMREKWPWAIGLSHDSAGRAERARRSNSVADSLGAARVQRRRDLPAPDPSQVGMVRAAERACGRSARKGTRLVPGCHPLPVQGKWSVQRNKSKAEVSSRHKARTKGTKRDCTVRASKRGSGLARTVPRAVSNSKVR